MNIKKTDYHDWIEKQLDGNLTDDEMILFQEKLATDPEFAAHYKTRVLLAENWSKTKEYGAVKSQIEENIKQVRLQKKNRVYAWSIAASFLVLLSISGVVMFSGKVGEQESLVKNNELPVVPQIKQAEEKASMKIVGKLELVAPNENKEYNRNDSIVFIWKSDVDARTKLMIANRQSGKLIYGEQIIVKTQRFTLPANFLPEGNYEWFIEGFSEKAKFRIGSNRLPDKSE